MLIEAITKVPVRLPDGLAGLEFRCSRVSVDVLLYHSICRFSDYSAFRRTCHREPKSDLKNIRWVPQRCLCVPPPDFYFSDVRSMQPFSGLYFAYQGQQCVYVGESCDVPRRVTRRRKELSGLTGIGVLECNPADRKALESFFIGLLRPPRNKSLSCSDLARSDA